MIPLTAVAAQGAECLERLGILYALRDHLKSQLVAHIHDRPDDRGIPLIRRHLEDKRSIDLELGRRKPLEIGEGRVSRPEVVDRDADTGLTQGRYDAERGLGIVHDAALGNFQQETAWGYLAIRQELLDGGDETWVVEVLRGEVHGNRNVDPASFPGRALPDPFL
jgi:hypothetical protein